VIDFTAGPVAGDSDVAWIHGAPGEPPIQVHRYDEHTYVLRQGKAVNWEAPFLYLLFGNERALLLDTGATEDAARFPLRHTVDGLVDAWLAANPRDGYGLTVAHSHSHGDHVAGDPQFAGRPHTTVVGHEVADVRACYGLSDDPDDGLENPGHYDLGGRVLDVVAIPGHHPTSIACYDPWTGFLLTGDSVYPGRLYNVDVPASVASFERLVDFAAARQVTHVMGCHIEMSRRPGRDYPIATRYQPDEPPLPMTTAQLAEIRDAARDAGPGIHVHDSFVLVNGDPRRILLRFAARTIRQRLARRLAPG
jgi:glyoxylase-like metal-dependent hydrolase (beta-lactamase superfamily II)